MSSGGKLSGNWGNALRTLENLGDTVTEAARLAMYQGGLIIEKTIKGHFDAQDLGWEKLSAAYLEYKARKKLSTDILRATNTLYASITTTKTSDGKEVFVGVNRKAGGNGEDPVLVGAVMEFGRSDGRKPKARPWLEPSYKEAMPKVEERVQKQLDKALDEAARDGNKGGGL